MSPGRRRRWIVVAGGALAAAAGAGWSWWRASQEQAAAVDADALWAMRFARPQGGELIMSDYRGRALLLNFWATWCPPCIKEFPTLDQFSRSHGGQVQVIGLAIDSPAPVLEFLARQPVDFAIGLAAMSGTDLSRRLGNPSGVLPYTVLLNAKGQVVQRKLGETGRAELESWVQQL
jgi:thiol-disulfide isomerase/thioredoxin